MHARGNAGLRAEGVGTVREIVGKVALPVCEAVLAHRRGQHAQALEVMRPVLDDMHQLGGSHAQQDVLVQLYLDCAVKADRADESVRLALIRVDAPGRVSAQRATCESASQLWHGRSRNSPTDVLQAEG